MKVTVIGHWGGYPAAGEATSGYLIQSQGYNLLLDCGSAVLSNLQKYISINELDAVVLSHYHYDHNADIGPLQYARLINGKLGVHLKPLPIYGPVEESQDYKRLTMEGVTAGTGYREEDELSIGPFGVKFCSTKHPVKCFAIKVFDGSGCVLYTADTSYFDGLADFAKGCDLIICECNLYSSQDGSAIGHMNSTDAGRLAECAGADHLLLTHLPHYGSHNELEDDASGIFRGTVEIANPGWSINL